VRPLAIDLYCGLGGWADGFLAEGYDVIGFDIERHDYGTGGYPGQLVLQDVLTLHGSQFKDAAVIVASPPCQAYSYRAMPWKRAKTLPPPDNTLFEACFRIQREAEEAAGRRIPLIVENVQGAQKWVGQARWHFGSFYLWGDVPALMPLGNPRKLQGKNSAFWSKREHTDDAATEAFYRKTSKSVERRAASAQIAKIPFSLAQYIARCFKSSGPFQCGRTVATCGSHLHDDDATCIRTGRSSTSR